jgi:creatinine amidohydrolase
MRFEELNWFDIENYLQQEDRLILILGSCEQHAYLSLLTDVRIPMALADAASQQTNVLVAPALNFGASPYFLDFPGTISLRISTLLDIIEDIIESIYRQGFRRILILNGHGGNSPVQNRLYEIVNSHPNLQIAWYAWWQSHNVLEIAQKYNLKPSHASWLEAFPFTQVGLLPDENKNPPHIPGLLNAKQARIVYGDGNFGGPYHVDASIMQEIFTAALQDILELLDFKGFDKPEL